jgi:hypothetical protein
MNELSIPVLRVGFGVCTDLNLYIIANALIERDLLRIVEWAYFRYADL